jgi:hypothetical protein
MCGRAVPVLSFAFVMRRGAKETRTGGLEKNAPFWFFIFWDQKLIF